MALAAIGEACGPEPAAPGLALDCVEHRASDWVLAARGLLEELAALGVAAGQVLRVDAHNNGADGEAIFAAFFTKALPPRGPLRLTFEHLYPVAGLDWTWEQLYGVAGVFAEGKDVVSITGACSAGQRAVLFVFYNETGAEPVPGLEYVESRAGSWNAAANGLLTRLAERQVQHGQILSIDAHNNSADGDAIFSAHFAPARPGRGPLRLAYEAQNAGYQWQEFYAEAVAQVGMHRLQAADVVGLTGSCNLDRAVLYLFYQRSAAPPLPALARCDGRLRVLSFNIWRSGGDSLPRTLGVLEALDADVVCLQEVSTAVLRQLARSLRCHYCAEANVLSRFPLAAVPQTGRWAQHGTGLCVLQLPQPLVVANCHLRAYPYAPYAQRLEGLAPGAAAAVEAATQLPTLQRLLGELAALPRPQLLCGDFNAASHLDYPETPWPCSSACRAAGLVDTYAAAQRTHLGAWRQGQGDAPGITWAAKPQQEPHGIFDRIDFVYASPDLEVESSRTVDSTPLCSRWPSDHRAVLSVLRLQGTDAHMD